MEDIQEILQYYDNSTDSDSSYEASNVRNKPSTNLAEDAVEFGKNTELESRQPTRRPDPNIYNRNALLARENRRKKKAYLETLEKELNQSQNMNRTLLKTLKKQHKVVRRLEREKQYYKSIFTNRKEIVSLLEALNTCMPNRNYFSGKGSSTPSRDLTSPEYSPGTSKSCSESTFTTNESTDDTHYTLSNDNLWNDLLENDLGFKNSLLEEPGKNLDSLVPLEHDETINSTGVCLHITGGKVSLEFCPSCQWNSSIGSPEELLHTDFVP